MNKDIKPHEIVSDWKGLSSYPKACKLANDLTKLGYIEEDVFAAVTFLHPIPGSLKMRKTPVPHTIFGEGLESSAAYEQLQIALKLPVAIYGALMPDAHKGYALPIGGVLTLRNAISPYMVGVDISCMVYYTQYSSVPWKDFLKQKKKLFEVLKSVTSFGVGSCFPSGVREHAVMDRPEWNEFDILKRNKDLAQSQLGSSGGGNHFANLMSSYKLVPTGRRKSFSLLTHSGSRGVGNRAARYYSRLAKKGGAYRNKTGKLITYKGITSIAKGVPDTYEWFDLDSELGQEYFAVMTLLGDYALANHELIHDHFSKETDIPYAERPIWNRHNFAWIEGEDKLKGQPVVLHRKGATPAHKNELGIIPGTCGTPSFLVSGRGLKESLNSSSHGAGRPHSRTKAKESYNKEKFEEYMRERGILHEGIDSDETPEAYKDIMSVMNDQKKLTLVMIKLQPEAVIMGGKEVKE